MQRVPAPLRPNNRRAAGLLVLTCSTLTQLCLHLAVGPVGRQLRQLAAHGGDGDDGFEAALPFGDVLLWVEDDDVDLRYVEHSQRDGGAEAEGHSQRGGLDVQLKGGMAATPGGGLNDNCPVKHQRKRATLWRSSCNSSDEKVPVWEGTPGWFNLRGVYCHTGKQNVQHSTGHPTSK